MVNVLFGMLVTLGLLLGMFQYSLWSAKRKIKKLNVPKFVKGDVLLVKPTTTKKEAWEKEPEELKDIRAIVDEVGTSAYKLIYKYKGMDVAIKTEPFYIANSLLMKEEKRPSLSLVHSDTSKLTH